MLPTELDVQWDNSKDIKRPLPSIEEDIQVQCEAHRLPPPSCCVVHCLPPVQRRCRCHHHLVLVLSPPALIAPSNTCSRSRYDCQHDSILAAAIVVITAAIATVVAATSSLPSHNNVNRGKRCPSPWREDQRRQRLRWQLSGGLRQWLG